MRTFSETCFLQGLLPRSVGVPSIRSGVRDVLSRVLLSPLQLFQAARMAAFFFGFFQTTRLGQAERAPLRVS